MKFVKLTALVLCICLALTLAACGGNEPADHGNLITTAGATTEATQPTQPTQATQDGPNENQCAADPTTEATEFLTEPSESEETTQPEAPVVTEPTEDNGGFTPDEIPGEEVLPGDIEIPMP